MSLRLAPRPAGPVQALRRIEAADRPEIWISLRDQAALGAAPEGDGPLAGSTLAVKDNIDVAGLPTTAACPAFAYVPERSAPAVQRLEAAGATVLGKTNLDQFATGLVGTRSPYGAVRDARRPQHVSGGSSSGSAVAVAMGLADLALGTDTAGSGRVPAAFQGVVGVKPTRGLVPTLGVVPACVSLDCVTVFARSLGPALAASAVLAGPDPADPHSRPAPPDAPLAAPATPRVGVPSSRHLHDLTPAAEAAFAAAAVGFAAAGAEIVTLDELDAFFAAGELLYGGAFIAERYAAVGEFIAADPAACDPVVASLVLAAADIRAAALVADREHLAALALDVRDALGGVDALLTPTAPLQPTIAAVAADPIGVNARLGRYTAPANLLDLCALALPAGEADGGQFGVQLLAPAFHDAVIADIAARRDGEPCPEPAAGLELLVVGAHRRGQPLAGELTAAGARYVATVRTAARYRLHALDTVPPKPGLVRLAGEGASIEGEVWALPPAGLGRFAAAIAAPMTLGSVELDDGRRLLGFLCEPVALDGAPDISDYGSWPAYLAR